MKKSILSTFLALCLCYLPAAAAIIYVNGSASGTNTGVSWTNAYDSLQTALSVATFGDEIWVVEGTYHPTAGSLRTKSFELVDGVKLLGGFSGTEVFSNQRNPQANVTILSGEIGSSSTLTDNSYHVLIADNKVSHKAVIDGFTIEHGYANGTSTDKKGAGLWMNGSDLTVRNCVFSTNHSFDDGAGIHINPSGTRDISIRNCAFEYNEAHNVKGAGFYIIGGNLDMVKNCSFRNNIADKGAGVYISDSATVKTITKCTFKNNHASHGAGIYINIGDPSISECTFSNATATFGGGVYLKTANLTLTTSQFDSNTTAAGGAGGGIFNANGVIQRISKCSFNSNSQGAIVSHRVDGSIDSCTFQNNEGINGGALSVNNGLFSLDGCQFRNNYASKNGGAIYQFNSEANIYNCQFDSNTTHSDYSGGAIYIESTGGLGYVHNTMFTWNSTGLGGGAIYGAASKTVFSNSSFVGNTVVKASKRLGGGAIYMVADTINFSQCLFKQNKADGPNSPCMGGAVVASDAHVSINKCQFLKNELGAGTSLYRYGGAVALKNDNGATITNSVFYGNSTGSGALSKGGALYTRGKNIMVQNSVFSGNKALGGSSFGGACYLANPYFAHCTFANNASNSSYATVYVDSVASGDTALIINCIIWDNASTTALGPGTPKTVRNSIIQGGYSSGTNILNSNPLFEDANGADNISGSIDDDLRISANSPAIDYGLVAGAPTRDITSHLRDLVPDIGAYEHGTQKTLPSLTNVQPQDTSTQNPPSRGFSIPDTLYTCPGNSFHIPITTRDTLQHVIGLEYKLHYDTTVLRFPNRTTQIGTNMIDTNYVSAYGYSPPGTDYVNIILVLNGSGPSGTCWNGTGEVVAIEFRKKKHFLDTTLQFRLSEAIISYSNHIASFQSGAQQVAIVQGSDIFASTISYWDTDSLFRYDSQQPRKYNKTTITPTSIGGTVLGSSTNPNWKGIFYHDLSYGKHVTFARPIKGSSTDSVGTDVMSIINGMDAWLALKVMLEDNSFIPTIFQMIAMDVNRDGVISAGDISQINMRTVGKYPEFRQRGSHKSDGTPTGTPSRDCIFIDSSTVSTVNNYQISSNYPYPDPAGGYTKNNVPVPPTIMRLPTVGDGSCPKVLPEKYYAVFPGDIDPNWDTDTSYAARFKKSNSKVSFGLALQKFTRGSSTGCVVEIPVSIKSLEQVFSLDFNLELNNKAKFIGLINHNSNIDVLYNAKSGSNLLLTSFFKDLQSTSGYPKDKTLFTLQFEVTHDLVGEDILIHQTLVNGQRTGTIVSGDASCITNIEPLDEPVFLLFPNPVSNVLTIEGERESGSIEIIDISGKVLIGLETTGQTTNVDVSKLPSGTYMVQVLTGDQLWQQRFVKL